MADNSNIEWTDSTWNPIRARLKEPLELHTSKGLKILQAGTWGYHCERVSPGCVNCYACTMNGRTFPAWGTGLDYTVPNRDKVEIFLDREELERPLHWKKPRMVFPCSMTDLFGDWVPVSFLIEIFGMMRRAPQHTYQILTKRSTRMRDFMKFWVTLMGEQPPANWWFGVSVEDQPRADERIPHLLQTPAAVRWVSLEPMLGTVEIDRYLRRMVLRPDEALTEKLLDAGWSYNFGQGDHPPVDWVVVGGESGSGARPINPQWVRSLQQECHSACVPFFFKQWGEFIHQAQQERSTEFPNIVADGAHGCPKDGWQESRVYRWPNGTESYRCGVKAAGRLLDGREWNEMPEVRKWPANA